MAFVEINRFNCIGDDGKNYVVIERQDIRIYKAYSGNQKTKGIIDYTTKNGTDLNKLDDNTFKIVDNDIVLRKI